MTANAWAKRAGKTVSLVLHRLKHGWSVEDAVFGKAGLHGVGRKPSKMLTVGSCTMSIEDWVRDRGLNRTTIEERLKRGWSEADAVMKPLGSKNVSRRA